MSVPIAVVGLIPKRRTSRGVIRDPPPIPVIPTRKPTPKPKKMMAGSIVLVTGATGLDEGRFSSLFPFMTERVLKESGHHSPVRRFPLIAGVSCVGGLVGVAYRVTHAPSSLVSSRT